MNKMLAANKISMKNCKILIIYALIHVGVGSSLAQSTVHGYIITNTGDTLQSVFSIAKKKRIDGRNNLSFAEVLFKDSLVRLTSKDILGYKKSNTFYKSFRLDTPRDTTFFGKLITSGKVDLYYGNVYDGKYYFKREGVNHFYELDSKTGIVVQNKQDIWSPYIVDNESMPKLLSVPNIKSNEGAFRDFFVVYFKDNLSIVNKLKHGFYSFSSIEIMFKEYNQQL